MALQQYPKLKGEDLYGRVVYLLGSSELGIKNKPTLIENEYDLIRIFGTKGDLVDGYRQVKEGSENSIVYLCKTTGEHAVAKLDVNVPGQEKIVKDGVVFLSAYANEKYNDIRITLTSDHLTFVFPELFLASSISYRFDDYPTLFHLMNAINSDTQNGRNHVFMQCFSDVNIKTSTAIHTINPTEIALYGGASGLDWNKNQLYHALNTTYTLLLGDDIDRIVPLGAFLDSMFIENETSTINVGRDRLTLEDGKGYLSFYRQLLLFCISQMKFGMITRGVMGYYTTSDKYLQNDFEGYLAYVKDSFSANLSNASDLKESYGLIDACVGDVYYDYGAFLGNHYTAYAGLSSGLPLKDHTTNKTYNRSITIRNEFGNEHFVQMMDNSLVGVRVSPLTDLVTVVNGVTTAPWTSDLHHVCNMNMIQITAFYIQRVFNRYLGENIVELIRNRTLHTELNAVLGYLKSKGIIEQYKAQILEDEGNGQVKYLVSLKSKNMINFIGLSNSINYISG